MAKKIITPPSVKKIEAGCPTCQATGFHGDDPVLTNNPFCPDCGGKGKILVLPEAAQPCPACAGRGHVEHVPCPPCGHTGKVLPQPDAAPEAPADSTLDELSSALFTAQNQVFALQKANADLDADNKALSKENAALKKKLAKAPTAEPAPEAPPAP